MESFSSVLIPILDQIKSSDSQFVFYTPKQALKDGQATAAKTFEVTYVTAERVHRCQHAKLHCLSMTPPINL